MRISKLAKFFNIIITLAIWGLILFLPFLNKMDNVPFQVRHEIQYNHTMFTTVLMLSYYIHFYLIYPLRKKKNGTYYYLGTLIVLAALYIILNIFFLPDFPQPPGVNIQNSPDFKNAPLPHIGFSPMLIITLIPFTFVLTVGFCYRLYVDTALHNKLLKEREYAHVKTELDFLRSQISPHFIFNLMNTLVSMARKKSDLLESSLISLSQLMRYMLYETDGNQINLSTELDYLKNYINLQLLRFGDDIKVNLNLEGLFEKYTIEPMLLIPFVENAFKHSIVITDKAIIDISLVINEKERMLSLTVLNSVAQGTHSRSVKNSGIGLANVKRRLELLYPGKHMFTTNHVKDTFIVNLQINL
ncbi:histidine kinase [Mucilaginibacter sp. HMF5004]|uniref:sensor histidine kinase n=1 Tax=Mucilaginibacter rivuli TaxID=2857527 RepID=UPI001C5ECFA4|nr:histidine kinase [Mucilaginibacter rivuli]MBW4888937.1 histidine kinase [Mucilaginibacter rivuli]